MARCKLMKKLWVLAPLMMVLLAVYTLGAGCTYTSVTDGTDYMGVTSTAYNTTAMESEQLFTGYTYMTPRLNFTVPVNDTVLAGMNGTNTSLHWKGVVNFSTSLVVKNGTTVVDASNYTLVHPSSDATVWALYWNVATYNGTTLNVYFNRTFVKNVDDIVANASQIYTGATAASFVTTVTPSTYGASGQVKISSSAPGVYLSGNNWATGWGYTQRTCTGTTPEAISGAQSTKLTIYAAFGLLAVLLLVMCAWGIIQMFNGGGMDMTVLAAMVIGGAIVLVLAYVIISYVAAALGA